MKLKLLNKDELSALYQSDLCIDFPKSELKPLRAMHHLMELGRYDPLLLLKDEKPVGYAMLWLPSNHTGALLEYFGVLRGLRNSGLGSEILQVLLARYGQLFGEAEIPNSGISDIDALRRRRLAFYQRNGFRIADYECALFGVHFNCLYAGPITDDRAVESLHRSVYADYFSPEHMARYIQLPLSPGEEIHPAPEWVEEFV